MRCLPGCATGRSDAIQVFTGIISYTAGGGVWGGGVYVCLCGPCCSQACVRPYW
jgi:hypothetical protein